ncbi:protein kinase [Nonomuraea sp. NPDC050786]|uniref:WD40 repeat domain-containing serine/threonine protein kinase n=1 Tax=Nonomuraea sp. NPDC050786 TaxID=3154840 RepID=UPI0033D8EE8E
MPDMRPLRPGDPERIGSYRLVGVLGSGGQGVVYRGVGDRDVAIKVLHGHLSHDDDATKGFLREVEAARRVAAFCTAAILDVGTVDDRPYIVSEYVPGDTLQAVVRTFGRRVGGALDRLAISTLTALVAIHQAGIVHRDFKPGNVLMGPDGPIVIDFGIAKALDATTGTSAPVGTPAYMSPEQFRGERVGPASDVFSWAGTMVFAATGRTPFAGDTVAAVVNSVLSGVPDLSGVPPHLLPIIETCLSKDAAVRPSPAELLQRLIRQAGPGAGALPGHNAGVLPGHGSAHPVTGIPPIGSSRPAPAAPPGAAPVPGPPSAGAAGAGPAGSPPVGTMQPPKPPPAGSAHALSPPAGSSHAGPPPAGSAYAGPPPAGSAHAGPPPPRAARPLPGDAPAPAGRPPLSAWTGFPAGNGSVADADTAPGQGRPVSRRAMIGGAAAAAAAALAVSAFTVFRPRDDLPSPIDRSTTHPTGGGQTATAGSPTAASPTPAASAQPFGTQLAESVPLPAADGAPKVLAATGGTVVCGTAKGAVSAWDLGQAPTRLGDGGGSTAWVAAGSVGGTPVVASGHLDGRMRLWSLAGESLASHKVSDPVIAVTVAAGAAVAVSQKYDDMKDLHSVVRLWDISTGKQIGPAINDHFQGVRGLAFGRLGEDDVLVTGDGRQRVRVWRLSDGKMTHSFHTGEIGGIELLACGEVDGKAVLVSTHLDATLRVYDLATGKRRKKWTFSDQSPDDRGAAALVAGRVADVPFAAVAHAPWNGDVIVRVWDLRDGDVIGVLGPGRGGAIRTLALAEQDGRPVLAGTGDDRALRVWSLGPS